MEQTIGKRIAANRKRLKLTQDQLAEKLGVTAQAVSKWENDQSCPDIATLPKLAEIFGVTTDALLGRETQKPVQDAEVIYHNEDDDDSSWDFTVDHSKKGTIGLAIWILLAGGLLLTARLLNWETGFWDILWPSALLVFGIFGLFPRFSFFRLGCGLFGGYYLLCNLNITTLRLDKDLLLPICLLLFGLSLLVDALRKKTGSHFYINRKGSDQHRSTCTMGNESFQCSTSFGESHRTITLPRLSSGEASVSFGNLTVDLSECEEISGNCRIEAHCSFGEMEILVPRRWRVEHNASSAFANVDISGHPAANAEGTIFLDCHVSFGEIDIKYI